MTFLCLTVCTVTVVFCTNTHAHTFSPNYEGILKKMICFAKLCFSISWAPTVFQVLHMHYATSMFGNANSSLLCSNIALHAAYITGHSYYGIICLFSCTAILLLFSQQMHVIRSYRMNSYCTLGANLTNKMEIQTELIIKEFP